MITNLKYKLMYGTVYTLSLLPLRALYVLSDFIYILLCIIGYRKKVIQKNLSNSFPEKSEKERNEIKKEFYHWFSDYMVETVKLCSMSREEMMRRMKFTGIEQIQEGVNNGTSAFVFLGHYCNWEWITSLSLHTHNCICGELYHKLESEAADRMFVKMRERYGTRTIDMQDTLPTLLKWQKEGHRFVIGFVADQVPGFHSMHYWPTFLNQRTPTYSGTERIAKLFNGSVYYLDIERPKRGYYTAHFIKMCDKAKDVPKFALTEQYYRMLETTIIKHPSYWLWSHNRWKRTWEDFCKNFPDEKERERIMSKL